MIVFIEDQLCFLCGLIQILSVSFTVKKEQNSKHCPNHGGTYTMAGMSKPADWKGGSMLRSSMFNGAVRIKSPKLGSIKINKSVNHVGYPKLLNN